MVPRPNTKYSLRHFAYPSTKFYSEGAVKVQNLASIFDH